ncbi:hypothetical protein C8R43DRAFT_991736 [Mycena crocata]|nr:hypothetical protein C8R43DRAFT_991736 [Mycena crocata]
MALSSSGITTTLGRSHLFLMQHPHLAHHIRDLAIDMPKDHGRQEVLETILKMLQNVERLAINGNILAWDELLPGPALRSTLRAVISLPSLDCLHILRLSDIPSSLILYFSSSVRVLSMNRVLPSRHKDHSLSNSTPRVEHLILPRWMTTHALLQVCDFSCSKYRAFTGSKSKPLQSRGTIISSPLHRPQIYHILSLNVEHYLCRWSFHISRDSDT